MGAIAGIINSNGITKNEKDLLDVAFGKKLNKHDKISDNKFFLLGHNARISPQSEYENNPLEDKDSGYIITSDAILDNRENTLEKIGIDPAEKRIIDDSYIILEAYKKYGEKCLEFLIGDFAFVIYNRKNKTIFCARDHVGKRSFYYKFDNNKFRFSTLSSIIFDSLDYKCPLNDRWITNYLSFGGPMHQLDPTITVFKGIKQLKPGHFMKVMDHDVEIKKYWEIDLDKKIELDNSEAYIEELKKILQDAVDDRLETKSKIGISLSGGLDSTIVAGLAANTLKEKKLKGYTSVPLSGYIDDLPKHRYADETKKVKEFSQMYENIENDFFSFDKKNSITDIEEHLECLEHPYKFIENFYWVDGISRAASEENCKILLNGTFGNVTISYGNIMSYLFSLYEKKDFLNLYKTIVEYSKHMELDKNKFLKQFLKRIFPKWLLKLLGKEKRKIINIEDKSLVNKDLAKKFNVEKEKEKYKVGKYRKKNMTINDSRNMLLDGRVFSHIGNVNTKDSLKYGVQSRDPTMDKRIIEYCFSIPDKEYLKNGIPRVIARKLGEDLIPDSIQNEFFAKGQQSPGHIQRLIKDMPKIKSKVKENIKDPQIAKYINIEKIELIVNKKSALSQSEIWILVVIYIFIQFIHLYNKK